MTDDKTPPRSLTPEDLKAFAHPLRMQIYDWLGDHGPATATTLAQALGESTGQTSYHLRQLARHGFVEEDPDTPAKGRERWWKPVGFSYSPGEHGEGIAAPGKMIMLSQIDHRAALMREWVLASDDRRRRAGDAAGPDPLWTDAAIMHKSTVTMTPTELEALTTEMLAVLDRHVEAARALPADRKDASRMRLYLDAFPLAREDD